MGSGMDLLTWMAASDAESAARDAESAANEAREESERLANLHQSNIRKQNIEDLNKVFQDLFYEREVDYYKVDNLKEFIGNSIGYRSVYPKPYHHYEFPYFFIIIFGISSYLAFPNVITQNFNGFTIFVSVVSLLSFLAIVKIHKNWFDWQNNKERIFENRQNNINNEYFDIMTSLKSEFNILSDRGIRVKYIIDKYIDNIYNILEKENPQKAKESLLKLYHLLLIDWDITEEDEKIITNIFLNRPGIKELINKNRLFTSESIEIYKNS